MKVTPIQNRTRASRRGFTLLELLIVMLLMAMVASLGIQRIADFEAGHRAERAARETLAAFRFARNLALTTGKQACVRFDAATNSFSVYWKSNGTAWDAAPVYQAVKSGPYTIDYDTTKELVGTSFSISPNTVSQFTYSALGTCDNAATVTFTYGTRTKVMTVTRVGDPSIN